MSVLKVMAFSGHLTLSLNLYLRRRVSCDIFFVSLYMISFKFVHSLCQAPCLFSLGFCRFSFAELSLVLFVCWLFIGFSMYFRGGSWSRKSSLALKQHRGDIVSQIFFGDGEKDGGWEGWKEREAADIE